MGMLNRKGMEMNWALVGMITMLIIVILVITLPKRIVLEAGGESAMRSACVTSLKLNSQNELWVSPKNTLINKDKQTARLECITMDKKIDGDDDKRASGEIVTMMEDNYNDYYRYAHTFYLDKGSICMVHYLIDLPKLERLEWLSPLMEGKNFGGFSVNRYANFELGNRTALIMVYGYSFMDGFSLPNQAGVLLWNHDNMEDLPCAVLEGDPMEIKKPYS
jgi:hypothetical protein